MTCSHCFALAHIISLRVEATHMVSFRILFSDPFLANLGVMEPFMRLETAAWRGGADYLISIPSFYLVEV